MSGPRISLRAFCIPPELPNPFPAPNCLDREAEEALFVGVLLRGLPQFFVGVRLRGLPQALGAEVAEEEEEEDEEEDDLEKDMIILMTRGFPLIMSVILSTCGSR